MMKSIRFFAVVCLLAALSISVTACDGKDGGDEPGPLSADEQMLVGKWLFMRIQVSVTYPDNPGMSEEWDDDLSLDGDYLEFKANRTFDAVSQDSETGEIERVSGTWSISNGKLIPRELDGEVMEDLAGTIKSLTETELQIEARKTGKDEDGNYESLTIGTFKKQ